MSENTKIPAPSRSGPVMVKMALALLAVSAGVYLGIWQMFPSQSHPPAPPISREAKSAAESGSLTPLQGELAPNFRLTDQAGRQVSLRQFRGHTVVLAAMDPHCHTVCPVLAGELRTAEQRLDLHGAGAVFIGLNVDPYWNAPRALQAFDLSHGLSSLRHWYFVTGSAGALNRVWQNYHLWVQQFPASKSVNHASYVFVIGPHGHERWLLTGSADRSLSASYSTLITDLVHQTTPGSGARR